MLCWNQPVETKTRTYHVRAGQAGRRTEQQGGAGGWAERDADGSVRPENNRPSYSPGHRRKPSWTCLWKHEQTNRYVNRWKTKYPVDVCFIRGTTTALRSWLLTSVPIPNCLCKPFSFKACPGKFVSKNKREEGCSTFPGLRTKNPDHLQRKLPIFEETLHI